MKTSIGIGIDGRIFNGIITAAINGKQKIQKAKQRINKKYNKIVFNGLDKIAHNAIEDFYDSYDDGPHVYRRKHDLYNAYQITATDEDWFIDVNSQYMKKSHRAGNSLIYDITMKVGAHGGAPHDGDYYWRWPSPREAMKLGVEPYSEWFDTPAVRGPEDTEGRITDESAEFIEEIKKNRQEEYEEYANLILDDIEERVIRLLS